MSNTVTVTVLRTGETFSLREYENRRTQAIQEVIDFNGSLDGTIEIDVYDGKATAVRYKCIPPSQRRLYELGVEHGKAMREAGN